MLLNGYYPKSRVLKYGLIGFFLVVVGLGTSVAQKKAKKTPQPVIDQFPVSKMWDEALAASQKSGRPVLIFNVDYVDSSSIAFRDRILRNLEVQAYLNATFELGVNDFSIDPPPSVGLDSLRNLGLRLDALESGFRITERPTAIILRPDSTEVDRIVHPENLTPQVFITTLQDYLAGKNTLATFRERFWRDSTNDDERLAYINKLADHSELDSLFLHVSTLSHSAKDLGLRLEAAKQYAYMQFQFTGNPDALYRWLPTLNKQRDSNEIFFALMTIVEYQERSKRVDSISTAYERVFDFIGYRDPDLLNNYAWSVVNFSTRRDTAMRLINEAIAANGKNPNYYDTRALVHFFLDDFDASAADSRIALSLATTEEDIAYFRERVAFYEKEAKDKRDYYANPDNKD